jgi:hypothetical protein
MRRNIRAIVVRLRARKRLYAELGLDDLDLASDGACAAMWDIENKMRELELSPNVVAALLLMGLDNECSRSDSAEGNGYCGTMAMTFVAMRGLLRNLSGLILEHAAFYVDNPTTPLRAMPFAAV